MEGKMIYTEEFKKFVTEITKNNPDIGREDIEKMYDVEMNYEMDRNGMKHEIDTIKEVVFKRVKDWYLWTRVDLSEITPKALVNHRVSYLFFTRLNNGN
jgi:hypothetical protein